MSGAKKTYAIAATYTKPISSGLNIQCAIRKIIAVSIEEAIGFFVIQMSDELPDHSVHVRPVGIAFEDAPQDTFEGVPVQPTTAPCCAGEAPHAGGTGTSA